MTLEVEVGDVAHSERWSERQREAAIPSDARDEGGFVGGVVVQSKAQLVWIARLERGRRGPCEGRFDGWNVEPRGHEATVRIVVGEVVDGTCKAELHAIGLEAEELVVDAEESQARLVIDKQAVVSGAELRGVVPTRLGSRASDEHQQHRESACSRHRIHGFSLPCSAWIIRFRACSSSSGGSLVCHCSYVARASSVSTTRSG